jgi:hypothetical protein
MRPLQEAQRRFMMSSKLTPDQFATQEYNLLVDDLFDAVPRQQIESHEGQALIRYFEARFKAYVVEQSGELNL